MIKWAEFFINRSFIVNLITGFLIITGIVVATSMQRDLVPPFQWDIVSVDVVLPGATPEEIERYVTFPLEEALRGTPGVERIDSHSVVGAASIRLMYEAGYSQMSEAVNAVESRIGAIRSRLPKEIRHINTQRTQVNKVFLFFLGFPGLDDENPAHRAFYKGFIKTVNNVPGVVHTTIGLKRRDIYVQLDQKKLNKNEISVSEVRTSLSRALNFAPVGQMMIGDDKFTVQIDKIAKSLEDIAKLPLRTSQYGKTILLKDIANVRYKNADKKDGDYYNGKKGTYTTISKDMSTDSIDLKPIVQKVIDEYKAKAPAGVGIVNLADGPYFIEQQISVLTKNGAVGFLIVILILMVFLNWRIAIMTALGLPVAYAGALIVLFAMGIKIDLLSIIGMILVVGILVDDAIIVAERYAEHLSRGLTPQASAKQAIRDLIVPVTGTVATTIVAFLPMVLIKSEMAAMLFAVPVVVITALIASYLECFFVLPNHLSHFVKQAPAKGSNPIMKKVQGFYEHLLGATLRFRYLALSFVVLMTGLSWWIGTYHMKHNFALNVNAEHVVVYGVLKHSDSLEETRKAIVPVEKYLLDQPKGTIENVWTEIGKIWMDGREREGYEFIKMRAYLDRTNPYPSHVKKRLKADLEKNLQGLVESGLFEKLYVEIEQQSSELKKANMISVRIIGDDNVDFQKIESHVKTAGEELPSIANYVADADRYQRSWVFVPDLKSLSQYGIDHQVVAHQIRSYFTPDEVIETRLNGESVFVYTEFLERGSLGFDHLRELTVTSTKGIHIPLSFLGKWKQANSLKKITHFGGERNLTMDFKFANGTSKATAQEELSAALVKANSKFPTYRMNVVESNEDEAKSQLWALKVAGVCIAGVLLVMALILGSVSQALIVGLPIPFGFIGIIMALYFHNLPLGVMALVGLVGTVGIAVNASIVMVDQINQLSKGYSGMRIPRALIVEGATGRLRAILLTTVTTLGGIFPIAYSIGGESGFTQPLTFSMGWGLSCATLLTLFLLPALLEVREDILALGRSLMGSKTTPSDSLITEEGLPIERPLILPTAEAERWRESHL